MAHRFLLLLMLVLFCRCGTDDPPANAAFPTGRWIDLTHDFAPDAIYWPTAEGFELQIEFNGFTDKGYFYSANRYKASEHGGTHVDAPIHFAEGKRSLAQIPLDRLIGAAGVVDVTAEAAADRDYQVTQEDFEDWEAKHGRLPPIVLLNTGFHRFWPDRVKYMGTDERGAEAVRKLHFPGLHPDAAKWLIAHRKVRAVGLDTPSIDYGQSQQFMAHRILSENNVPVFENVANLDAVPATGAWVIALPMKIRDGTGGPLRIAALVSD